MTVFFATLLFFSIVYIIVILILFRGLCSLKTYNECGEHSFSVVIAARNEESNIRKCLDTVLNQSIDRSLYEVILVNDRSTDTTLSIVQEYALRYSNLKVVNIESVIDGISPKKYAVSQGIARAENEIVVFTDADCEVTPDWLSIINRTFSDTTGLVQGITSYSYIDEMNKTFWGIQSIDFLSHGVVAASAIGAGIPINSNANNFAFRRSVFNEIGGYDKETGAVVSGDDDLLLQKIWRLKKWEIRYMVDEMGSVSTLPTKNISGVFEQRKRWGSKTVHYNALQVVMLSGIFLFYLSIVAAFFTAIFSLPAFYLACGLIIIKMTGELILLIPGTRIFRQKALRKYIIPASLIQLPLVIAAVISGVSGKFNWKDQVFSRKVKSARH